MSKTQVKSSLFYRNIQTAKGNSERQFSHLVSRTYKRNLRWQ